MAAINTLAQVGPILTMTLAAIGSCIGCYVAGSASHGAMAKTEEGHGKFIGMSAAPSSQCIYGFILMLLLFQSIQRGNVSDISSIGIGLFTGLAFMTSAIFQGKVCATGIQASLKQPSVYGKCFAAVGILESFALFVLVFTLMII
jgi:V/A-type H+-transporting ATPase subunit K